MPHQLGRLQRWTLIHQNEAATEAPLLAGGDGEGTLRHAQMPTRDFLTSLPWILTIPGSMPDAREVGTLRQGCSRERGVIMRR